MAQEKTTERRPLPVAYLASVLSLLVILITAVEISAQPRRTKRSGSTPTTAKQDHKVSCDALAGHPDDKNRTGPGVADEEIVPSQAISKCLLAVNQNPAEARFQFQLGRAYWAAKRYDEALDAFLKAEEMTYAPAYFYLGQAYEQGFIAGVEADNDTARNLYLIAASEGFKPAIHAYEASEEVIPDFSEFNNPTMIKGLYEADPLVLKKYRPGLRFYTRGIQRFLRIQGHDIDPRCKELADDETGQLLDKDYLDHFRKEHLTYIRRDYPEINKDATFDDLVNLYNDLVNGRRPIPSYSYPYIDFVDDFRFAIRMRDEAIEDMSYLAYDYGLCHGPAVKKVYSSVKRYARGEWK